MTGRTTATALMVLVSVAGTARADGVGWGPHAFDGILVGMAIVGALFVFALYTVLKPARPRPPVTEPPPAIATARVHRELSRPE